MIDRGRHNLLGVLVNAVDYEFAVDAIFTAAAERRPYGVSALAVHGVMMGVRDAEQLYRLNHLDLVVPDGQPVRWGLNLLYGLKLHRRVYGPELTRQLCQEAATREIPVYFYGSRPEVLSNLSRNLKAEYPGLTIAGTSPSRFRQLTPEEKREVVDEIRASGAQILFVGLGCPRQEVFAYEFREAVSMPVIAVGAAFDFHAGTLRQAPAWMGAAGLEWFYRLICEPRRLARRYLLLNPLYLILLASQKLDLRRFPPETAARPQAELLYG